MNELFPKVVMDHFKNPRNIGEIKNADGVGKVGNFVCGDIIWLYIKVKKNKKNKDAKIIDVKFQTLGCTVAIAVSSIITTLAKGKTISNALKINKDSVLKMSGNVPNNKVHCSFLADDALHEAIYDYLSKNKMMIPEDLKKRHKKIKKELEITEDKHEEYVGLEKKIFGK